VGGRPPGYDPNAEKEKEEGRGRGISRWVTFYLSREEKYSEAGGPNPKSLNETDLARGENKRTCQTKGVHLQNKHFRHRDHSLTGAREEIPRRGGNQREGQGCFPNGGKK